MNLRVFDSNKVETTVCFKLEQDGGDVNITACRPDGSGKDLVAWFDECGSLCRATNVETHWGFDLDDDGRVVIE
jgi:hypothetical protein